LEPPIGRHDKDGRLRWDCTRRKEYYNSVDIQTLIKSQGTIYSIEHILYWTQQDNIFEKWMNFTLELKDEGSKINKECKGSGDGLRTFGKLLGNSAYGQTIKADHNDNIQFINNIEDQLKFLQENKMKDIITCDDDDEGYHVFIGNKYLDETVNVTSRSVFLGSFILSYSRVMINDIIDCIYGEERYMKEGISKQIYTGDTDSVVVHIDQVEKLIKAGFIGDDNGKLTDDLFDKFIKGNSFEFAKITELVAPASKKYAVRYITPNNCGKEKIICNGLSKNNMNFKNPFNQQQTITKFNFACMKELYLNKHINHNFVMPDKFKKISIRRTKKEIINKVPMFSIHSSTITRELFTNEFVARHDIENTFYTIPNGNILLH